MRSLSRQLAATALGLPDDGRPLYVAVLGSDFGLLRLPGMGRLLRRKFSTRPTLLAPNAGWMQARLTELFGDVAEIRPNLPASPRHGSTCDVRSVSRANGWWSPASRARNWATCCAGARTVRPASPPAPARSDAGRHSVAGVDRIWRTDQSDSLRQQWFPGAAGLLTLSRHDEGRPQVMIEAMAAGLPVIASRIPAHADLIRHGETGWLVDSRNELAGRIGSGGMDTAAEVVGNSARGWVRSEIGTWDDCGNAVPCRLSRPVGRNPHK